MSPTPTCGCTCSRTGWCDEQRQPRRDLQGPAQRLLDVVGTVEVSEINAVRERALGRGLYLDVRSVDKFPPMLDFVVPTGVRVADAARVRLAPTWPRARR